MIGLMVSSLALAFVLLSIFLGCPIDWRYNLFLPVDIPVPSYFVERLIDL